LTRANIRNNGAKIDTAGFNITIGQALQHSAISGDNATDGGLTKNGAGTLTLGGTEHLHRNDDHQCRHARFGRRGFHRQFPEHCRRWRSGLDVSAVAGGFTLGAAQTLSGSGSVNGTVINNGTIAPGTAGTTGTLTFSNAAR
jgi:hypothetical protein